MFQPQRALEPGRIVVRSNHGHWFSWFLLGWLVASPLAAAVWFEIVNWPNPPVTSPEALATNFKANEGYRTPQLAFHASTGTINDPLPLGIALNNGSGGETLVLSDMVDGTKLSAGTALSPTRWSVPRRDLDNAFIAAPEDFSGSMPVTAKLYSSDNLLLETKNIRFEWAGSQTENRPASIDLTKAAPPGMPDLAADGKDVVRSSNRSGLTSGHGTESNRFEWRWSQTKGGPASLDLTRAPLRGMSYLAADASAISGHGADAPTTIGYSESSAQRSDIVPLSAADWLFQISSVLLPPDYHPFGEKPLVQPSTSPPTTSAALVERAKRLLREGNAAAARPLLRRATDAGSADAALDLAMSFDPSFVANANPGSVSADPVKAARWYKRAIKLGRKDAAADLERVTNMTKTAPP